MTFELVSFLWLEPKTWNHNDVAALIQLRYEGSTVPSPKLFWLLL